MVEKSRFLWIGGEFSRGYPQNVGRFFWNNLGFPLGVSDASVASGDKERAERINRNEQSSVSESATIEVADSCLSVAKTERGGSAAFSTASSFFPACPCLEFVLFVAAKSTKSRPGPRI